MAIKIEITMKMAREALAIAVAQKKRAKTRFADNPIISQTIQDEIDHLERAALAAVEVK